MSVAGVLKQEYFPFDKPGETTGGPIWFTRKFKDDSHQMTRKILTIAASAFAFSAFAPLTAQATSGHVFTNSGSATSILANATDSVDVTGITPTVDFSNFDPESGAVGSYTFAVAFNGPSYTVEFASANAIGNAFELMNGTKNIPYTIAGTDTDNSVAYVSGTPGDPIADANPLFSLVVPGLTAAQLKNAPAGAYSDTLTLTVTAD
jgi:hypothetical protein